MALSMNDVPVIWGVGTYQLGDSLQQVAMQIGSRAKMDVIKNMPIEEAISLIRKRLKTEHCDAIISAGSNAAFMQTQLPTQIVAVRIGGFDVMNALVRAKRISDRIGIILHTSVNANMQEFLSEFDLPVHLRYYSTQQDARNILAEFAAMRLDVIVGTGIAVHLAEKAGKEGVFLYTQESVRLAVEDGISLFNAKRDEWSRRTLLNTVLYNLVDGVIAVDTKGTVIAANPAAESLTGSKLESADGVRIQSLLPNCNLAPEGEEENQSSSVETIAGHTVVVNKSPLFDMGKRIGTVFSMHSPGFLERAFSRLRAHKRIAQAPKYTFGDIVAKSGAMVSVVSRSKVFAKYSDATVLIQGPSGSGKELLAQAIHNASARSNHPFIPINCGAFPESLVESELFGYEDGAFTGARRNGKAGLFEAAHKGTLFLDEVAELPPQVQTRLLRVLQEREVTRIGGHDPIPVDLRIIAATHKNLVDLVRDGLFRKDLFYRLSVLAVDIPPLCERREDFDILFRSCFSEAMKRINLSGMTEDLLRGVSPVLHRYDWPGNVRELANMAERLAMACLEKGRPVTATQAEALLNMSNIGPGLHEEADLLEVTRFCEMEHIREVLHKTGGNKEKAAKLLGITRTTLWRKLKAHEESREA